MSAPARPRAVPIYDSDNRLSVFGRELSELVQYRDLLSQLVSRNIKTRYKRSVLGIAWTMLNPLMTMAVLTFVFSRLFVTSIEHYPVYILSGLVFWTFFSQATTTMMGELVWGGSLFSRIYVPRSIFALSALGTAIVNIGFSLVPLVIIMAASGCAFTPALLFLPVGVLLVALFTLGIGLLVSTLAIQFADVVDIYQVLLTAWMYLTPIIYSPNIIPEQSRWLLKLNPMYHLLAVFRDPIHEGRLPDLTTVAIAAALAVGCFVAGWSAFLKKADEIAYLV